MTTGATNLNREPSQAPRRKRRRTFVDSSTSFAELVAILFDDEENAVVVEDAIRALFRQASESPNKWQIPEFPDALAGLVRLLFKDELPELQKNAAWAVANLASSHAQKNKVKLANFPQVLQGLVKLLHKDEAPGIQEEAVRALRNLACEQSNNQLISQYPQALSNLLRLLSNGDGSPEVQMQATMAVMNLLGNSVASRSEDQGKIINNNNINTHIMAYPDALTGIVKLLFEDSSLELQEQASYALVDLVENTLVNREAVVGTSAAGKGNVEKLADFPDALADLHRLFSYDPLHNLLPG
ncbi:hypothetical protein Mapa_003466 [Marchantia paleacea]|nr:hypothetical protein Mapa_003466 [Marchantia paleacea]